MRSVPLRPREAILLSLLLVPFTGVTAAAAPAGPAPTPPAPAAPPARVVVAEVPPSGGWPALAVGVDASGELRAQSCPRSPCGLAGATALGLPAELRAGLPQSKLTVLHLAAERRAVLVSVPGPEADQRWEALVLPAPSGAAPRVVFAGRTGWTTGQEGERSGATVLVGEPNDAGEVTVVVGEQQEHLSLCGRPAVLAPRALDARDGQLKPAKVQRLTRAEREAAPSVTARRLEGAAEHGAPGSAGLLRAVAASSALGSPTALTDSSASTTWAENRGGAGRGEFVLLQAPPTLPLTGFELIARPPGPPPPQASGPRTLWLAFTGSLLRVEVPEQAWTEPGSRWAIELPAPVSTDCVALVIESAWHETPTTRTTVAELRARTEFDGAEPPTIAAALAGGGERAAAAAAALSQLGSAGLEAVATVWDKLDAAGRNVALDVADAQPCAAGAPLQVRALLSDRLELSRRAQGRLLRCGEASAAALESALATAPQHGRPLVAQLLVQTAPERAVPVLVPLLERAPVRERRLLRIALARASAAPAAREAYAQALTEATAPITSVDLLRALGERAPSYREAALPLLRRLVGATDFRTRYLLLQPAAELAAVSPEATALLRRAFADSDPRLRARAAAVVRSPRPFAQELGRALDDAEMRVREAAIGAVDGLEGAFATPQLTARLRDDPWPLLRAAAAGALAQHPPSEGTDAALAEATRDGSLYVRVAALGALGARRAHRYAGLAEARLSDRAEHPQVRAAAAGALGTLCAAEAYPTLLGYARQLADPLLPEEQRTIGERALASLGRLGTAALRQDLAPLLAKTAPPAVRLAALRALQAPERCGARPSAARPPATRAVGPARPR